MPASINEVAAKADENRPAAAKAGYMYQQFIERWSGVLTNYASAISGSLGRLIFSLIYFIVLANTLSVADFGLFATASAAGVMLSRIVGLGFSSPLYRAATTRPNLIGLYTGGYLVMMIASLPLALAAGWITYRIFFEAQLAMEIFAAIVVTEALLWRTTEVIVVVNNGMNRFARAAVLVITGTALRAVAAGLFFLWGTRSLEDWSVFYIAANAIALLIGIAFFYPGHRIRFSLAHYWRRMTDSLAVAGAEVLFYLQMEMDKLLVLSLGGAELAGIYAIVMRLVDLTAIPIRTFSMMLVQSMMRNGEAMKRLLHRVGLELAIFAVSTAGLIALALLLHVFPNALGSNVSTVAPLIALALLVPALRNLSEYHAELLYARGQTIIRAINLAFIGCVKVVLLTIVLRYQSDAADLLFSLNGVFLAIYVASAVLTYSAMQQRSKAF